MVDISERERELVRLLRSGPEIIKHYRQTVADGGLDPGDPGKRVTDLADPAPSPVWAGPPVTATTATATATVATLTTLVVVGVDARLASQLAPL
jgi:hypothetical protein